jgi:hypothetical protein
MWITSKKTIWFPRLDIDFNHPLWAERRKYPEGFQIGNGDSVQNAPEWIMQDAGFALHVQDGNLVVKELPGEPQLEWKIPETAERDRSRGLARSSQRVRSFTTRAKCIVPSEPPNGWLGHV